MKLAPFRHVIFILVMLVFCQYVLLKPMKLSKNRRLIKNNNTKGNKLKSSPIAEHYISFKSPKQMWCNRINWTLRLKNIANKHIKKAVQKLEQDKEITVEEKAFHVGRFTILEKELNETQEQIIDSLNWLNDVLKGDYKDVINMKGTSQKRLEALRDATLKEEQEYTAILKAEEKMKSFNQSKVEGMLAEILRSVADAADKLEADLSDHVFDTAMQNQNKLPKGANIEAVIRLEDDGDSNKESESDTGNGNKTAVSKRKSSDVIKLVDAQDNQFVMSRGKDSTVPHEDPHLIQDVVYLVLVSFVCGQLCTLLGLPSMFGYILSGIILGPSGFNILKSLVQLETLGEFGVFFILFSVGLDFSPEKIKKVARVAVFGTTGMMVLMVLGGLGVGIALKVALGESMFVAACLSLSSTPLVIRFLRPSSDSSGSDGAGSSEYGMVLLGVLIVQDVLLGVIIALLPSIADNSDGSTAGGHSLAYLLVTLKLMGALLAIFVGSFVLARFPIRYVCGYLLARGDREITMLGAISLCFLMLLATEMLQVSMELGCFLAGVLLSAQGPLVSEHVETLIQPVKDFLAVLFFASIGLHIFPSFMVYELTYLITFTIFTVTVKFLISILVIALLLPHSPDHIKWLVAAGLAQVSEFSFVLGSRARRLKLISREVYLLILSVTTLSLLMAPLVWRLTLWQQKIKQPSRLSDLGDRPNDHRSELERDHGTPTHSPKIRRRSS